MAALSPVARLPGTTTVKDLTTGEVLANRASRATNPVSRGIGLMGRKALSDGEALIIEPCNSVVSFFMRFPIDVVFVSRSGEVVSILPSMTPWRASKFVRGAHFVIELPGGTAERLRTVPGNVLDISTAN